MGVSVAFAPPPLPVYVQPIPPGPNYMWIPGYWAWDPNYGYYWVPGTWVLAPYPGWLWTPGYWGWNNGFYLWYEGYWGPVVGFYGGINYGCGYNGYGYYGGYWRGNTFYYNRAVNHLGGNITTVYRAPVTRSTTSSRVSFNGGRGGVRIHPTEAQRAAAGRWASQPVAAQKEHLQAARHDPALRATANHGRPPVAATARPGAFSGSGVVPATRAGGPYRPPAGHSATGEHGRTAPPGQHPASQHPAAGHEGAPTRGAAPRGVYEQPSHRQAEPGSGRGVPREYGAPGEHRPAPVQQHPAPGGHSSAPPAVEHGPAREMPHGPPPSGGQHFEPRGGAAPYGAGGAPHGGGAPPHGGAPPPYGGGGTPHGGGGGMEGPPHGR
ncbi:MAG TPA: hypothetical protein VJ604_04320 [Geomonas sp.]|nr:hypothetical protein [Geomonas sp.]